MTSCPVCGWEPDPSVPNPENSVIAHMSSSKGEHEGIGFQKAKQMVWADEEINGTDNDISGDSGSDTVPDDANGKSDGEASGSELGDVGSDSSVAGSSGLGLSGENPFSSSEESVEESEEAMDADDPDSGGSDSHDIAESGAGAVVMALAAVAGAIALLGGRSGSSASQSNDGPELV
jgi:hypothetical protein